MDIVNTLEIIIPKMRGQMYQKKVHSLDVINEIIKQEGKYFPVKELDLLFAKFGVYLKSQEVTELLNHCQHSKTQISLVRMVELLKTDVPKDIEQKLNLIWNKLSGAQASMDVEELLQYLNENEHPQLELMKNNPEIAKESVHKGFQQLIGNNKIITKEQFLEFHYNIYWALPDFRVNNFKNKLSLMWGIRKLK